MRWAHRKLLLIYYVCGAVNNASYLTAWQLYPLIHGRPFESSRIIGPWMPIANETEMSMLVGSLQPDKISENRMRNNSH